MPVLAGAAVDGPSAFLVASPAGPVLLISDPNGSVTGDNIDFGRSVAPRFPVIVVAMPITLVGSFDG